MRTERVTHKAGEQMPMMLEVCGMPVVLPNEFTHIRRSRRTNTLVRNLRELLVSGNSLTSFHLRQKGMEGKI